MKYNKYLICLLGVMLILTGEVFSQNVTTLAGNGMAGFVNGIGVAASFNSPRGVTVDGAGNVYVADRFNNAIRKIDPAGVVTTLAGSAASGNTDATGVLARFNDPTGITVDALGNVYVGDRFNHRIRRITPAGVVTTIAGSSAGFADNVGAAAQFDNPIGVAVNPAGTILYVADYNNHRIRQVIIATGVVTTLAGSGTGGFADGFGVAAQFNLPTSVGVESSTGNVYVADSQNFRIRKINIGTGEVTTIAGSAISGTADGTGAAAQFINPIGCSIDGSGNIYTTDVSRVRRITPDGVVTRIAGSTPGFADGAPLTAQFNVTRGVAIDNQGNIYVGDEGNNRIRKIIPAPTITNLSPVTAASGATVTITGTNFTDATAVNFGGVAAASFTVVNASTITAVVASGGASGAVSVTAPGGTANSVMPFTFIPFPTITNFSPSGHSVGGLITITGTNFTGATAVNFGGVAASSFVVVNATTINAVVAGAGASGAVLVTTPGGTTGAPTAFTFFPSPSITTFSPSATSSGATITITGTNFTGAAAVSFGGVAAASFMVVNASTITAVVAPGGASGTISVTTPGGTVVSAMSNTFTPPPTISSFFPSTASSGATVTITGTNFTGASAVNFGGVAATSFMVLNPTTIVAVVASGGASGAVTVTAPGGTTGAAGAFTFIAPPTITNFIPTSSLPGVVITINGSGFNAASAVSFGGVPATNFTVVNSNQITAVVALGGATGSVQVTTPGGVASSGGFIFLAPPSITSFSPTVAGPGVAVTINGVNLGGTNSVLFGGIPATSIVVNSPTSVTAVVNNGASGNISLTTPSGATFASGFTYVPAPVVASFSPLNAGAGSVITITGANFIGATSVTLGGIPAASFVVSSSTEIKAVVPVGGASGSITVSTLGGSGSRMGFTFIPPPTITSFSPTIAATGMIMNISGTNFSGTTALRLGGVTAASYTVVSPTFISVVIGTGASGSVSVTTPGGVASQPGFTFIPPTKVTNFTPMSAAKGETVVITGISFVGVPQVSFGGSKAASYTVISSTEIHAVVGDGASGSVTVSTHVGTDSKPGFTFIPPPEITDFSPVRAPKGALVIITGVNFNGTTDVRFGGVPTESYTVISPTEIRAIVGKGLSGSVSVISTGGTVSKPGFTFIPSPTITSFTINPALTVATIIIRGTNFVEVSEVSFGGVTASSYTVISPTEIRAVVGAGAVGNISVTTPGGTAMKAGFTFIPLPTITRFTPINAPSGAEVTIVGSNFTGTTEVRFGGVIAARYTVISPTEI
ncbi:MAG: IPT/TIG domain-containing protein, partial [Candidatus Kapabacteria bacterium]|nr:IPT/TIG domain-containing protein [Candidatus Kapabacteria bacterium]